MIEKEFFTRPISTDISVATIGINKDDWYCHKPGMTRDEVKATMIKKGFDVVPIVDKNGNFRQYYTLDKSNDNKPVHKYIQQADRLYYLTHVRDAVWKMNNEKKAHYFLSNGKIENDIVGLLSLSNFICREFYVYVFALMSYIEREFASLIDSDSESGFIILKKLSHNDDLKEQLKIIEERWTEDKLKGNENDYKEYLYLHHLIGLVKAEEKYKRLDYKNEQDFETGTSKLKDIRNNIAHPVKSLVRTLDDLSNLNSGLDKLYEFKGRLERLIKHSD